MLVGTVEFTLFALLVVILAGPMIAERFRIPGLLGLIFFGMALGPNVLGWLGRVGLVEDLGTIGIIYLMFLAGLSFNLKSFSESRRSAITFGLLGFGVPFVLSLWVGVDFLDQELASAALIGAMWASNTLVAYPDVRSAGLSETRSVSASVSAGVVADLLSLLILAVVTSQAVIESSFVEEILGRAEPQGQRLSLIVSIPLLIGFTLWALPRIATWFYVKVGHSRVQRLLFSLSGMAGGAALAVAGGLEGIIGAFLAGLGLNQRVPAGSELMDRIDFVGSTIFIPAFLVSIGLTIDPAAFFDIETVALGLIFTGLVVVGKTIGVGVAGLISRYSIVEIGLMASLSFGQAASTLAIAQVGLGLGFFGQDVVNGAIFAIVATALITAISTRFFINRMPKPEKPPASLGERILVDARATESDLDLVMDFAGGLAHLDGGVLIPFAVHESGGLDVARSNIESAEEAAAHAGHDAEGVVRVSGSFATGTAELMLETDATLCVLPWTRGQFGSSYVFGSALDSIGSMSPIPIAAVQILRPWTRVVIVIGENRIDWHREDADLALEVGRSAVRSEEGGAIVFARDTSPFISELTEDQGFDIRTGKLSVESLNNMLEPDDLLVVPAYVLYGASTPDRLRLSRAATGRNVALVAGPRRMIIGKGETRRMERLVGPRT